TLAGKSRCVRKSLRATGWTTSPTRDDSSADSVMTPGAEIAAGGLLATTSLGVPSQPDSITINPNRRLRMPRLTDNDGARIEPKGPFTMFPLLPVQAESARQRGRAALEHSPLRSAVVHVAHRILRASWTLPAGN